MRGDPECVPGLWNPANAGANHCNRTATRLMAADERVATVGPTAAGQRPFEFPPCAVPGVNPLPLRLRPARMPGFPGSIALLRLC